MAYGRRYWRRYYRRYYRGKYSSYGKTRMTRNFKASAQNMTQGGTFNISVRFEDDVTLSNQAANHKEIDIANKIAASDMHNYLSNVFDQYRVEKLVIRLKPLGDTAANLSNPCILFTAMDRSGFVNNIPQAQIRTYGSYKETMVSGAKDISPTHVCYIGQSNLVEWSTYTDTKNRVTFPHIIWGVNYATATSITSNVSIEIDAQVRYRGVRLDTSSVQPNNPTNVFDLTINKVDCYYSTTANGQLTEVPVIKITGTTFTLSTGYYNYVYAVKVSGTNAYKEVRGAMVYSSAGLVEFENNLSEYNLYKGTVPNADSHEALQDMKLNLTFNEGITTLITCPEARENVMPLSIDEWPVVYRFNSE